MDKQIIDALLGAMIQSREGVSDLLFTVGRPPFVETHGWLEEFPVETPEPVFGRKEIDQLADHIINGDERLLRDLATWGSCDCSYALKDVARFRVNLLKKLRGGSFEMPSGLQIKTTPDKRATAIS